MAQPRVRRLRTLAGVLLLAAAGAAAAPSVALHGMLGGKALLTVDGGALTTVGAGGTYRGVKVVSTSGDQAVLEIDGKRHTLRVGDAPASVGNGDGGAPGNRIVMAGDSGGHFFTQGTINARPVRFLVDTGATVVALGLGEAQRLGLDYQAGQPVRLGTANGTAMGWRVRLASVRVGDVQVYDVEAVVMGQSLPYVLLGNSFLSRFRMKRDNDVLVLERRY